MLADELYVDRSALPPLLIARLARLAAFQNPEFYRAQAMRLPTYGKPRIICCASLESKYVVSPRGYLDEAVELLESNKIRAEFEDHREQGTEIPVRFSGCFARSSSTPSRRCARMISACLPQRLRSARRWSLPR